MSRHALAIVQLLSVVLLSALVSVLAKQSLYDVSAFTFAWLQIAVGITCMTIYTFAWCGERLPKTIGAKEWTLIAVIGICNFTIVRVMFMLALERLPATTHAYLINFVGIATMVMSGLVLKEVPSWVQVLGAILAIAGLRVFFAEVPEPSEVTGVIYAAIAVLALASYNIFARKLALVRSHGLSNNMLSTLALWIGGVPVVAAGFVTDLPPAVSGWQNWGIITLNGLVGLAVVMTVFNFVLRELRSYEASLVAATGVVFTALFAIPILGEDLGTREILGIAMMLTGIALVQVRGNRKP